jgi:4-hydroxybenzoate decarboxylase
MRKYIRRLLDRDEIHIVERQVDPKFELAAVIGRSQQQSDFPILFRNVKGSRLPVISNIYGSHRRLCEIIGAEVGDFCRKWQSITDGVLPGADDYTESVASEELVQGKLHDLPQITYCERDAGPYITAGVFLAKEPETGIPNLSFCRSMMVSDDELRVRLAPPHDITRYQKKAESRNEPLEVAILLGPPPEVFLAACASVPTEVDELAIAARLTGGKLKMRPCQTVDLQVPAETEIVIEGRILPHVRKPEGPFGEFLGYYVEEGLNHVFEITAVTWRPDACFHGLLCGFPEDLRALEVSFASRVYRQLSASLPGILDVSCSPSPMHTIVRINQQFDGHARQVMLKAFTSHFMYNKICIVVDEDVNIHDFADVWWAVLTRCRVDRELLVIPNLPGFFRDEEGIYRGRLGIDATKPFGQGHKFERKQVPGMNEINLKDYFA